MRSEEVLVFGIDEDRVLGAEAVDALRRADLEAAADGRVDELAYYGTSITVLREMGHERVSSGR